MWGGLRRWLGTAQQSLTAQGGALAAVNSNQVARYIESLVCFFVSETFLRLLLQGFRSASEPSRPPERRARWSLSHLALALKPGILVESQAGPDGKLVRVRGPRCPRQPARHARRAAVARAAHHRPKLPSQAVLCFQTPCACMSSLVDPPRAPVRRCRVSCVDGRPGRFGYRVQLGPRSFISIFREIRYRAVHNLTRLEDTPP